MIPTSGIYWNNYGKGRFSLLDIVKELVCDLRITRVPCLPEDNVMQGLILSQRQPDWNAVF